MIKSRVVNQSMSPLESSMASTPQTDNEISVRKVDVANSVRQTDQIFADRLFY